MVAGGTSEGYSTEIFDLATKEWRSGPQLPRDLRFTDSLQYGDSFALVGGFDIEAQEYVNTIYLYDAEVCYKAVQALYVC